MTTRSGRQYTLSSTPVIPITPVNPPKWSHKELFGPLDLANTQGGLHDLPKRLIPGYLDSQERKDPMVTHIGPSFVKGLNFTNLDKNTLTPL
jgi:hypothetical protein